MTQTAYGLRMDKALKALADRFQTNDLDITNPTNGVPPKYENTYLQRLATATNLAFSNGPDAVIDVQFDYRNVFLYIANYVTKEYPEYNVKPHTCLTPMSITGYCMALTYALALLNDDDNIRGKRSCYSQAFANDRLLTPVLDELRNLHVPPFMLQLLKSTTYSNDDRKPNLRFVYSLACFDYEHDFGRCFPVNLFFYAHHQLATMSASMTINDALTTWINTAVISQPVANTVSQHIGLDPQDLNDTNWISIIMKQLFNPTTSRYQTVRPTFNTMELRSQNHPHTLEHTLNPYAYLLCLDPQNIKTTRSVLRSISNALKDIYPTAQTLTEVQNTEHNQQLLNHYYQGIIKPTYFNLKPGTQVVNKKLTKIAENLKFHATPQNTHTIEFTTLTTAQNRTPSIYRSSGKIYDRQNDPIKLITDDPNYPPIDNIRHFLPNDQKPEAVFQNIITGKLIELGELDSVAIPHPNPENSVLKENGYFLNAAIPMTRIRPIVPQEDVYLDEVERKMHSPLRPNVRIDLLRREVDRIPIFAGNLETEIPQVLPGYDTMNNIRHTQFACNSIGHVYDLDADTVQTENYIRFPLAWSSYRFVHTQPYNVVQRHQKLMLLNFRTLFGLNVTLQETEHPSNMIDYS